ncbi:ribonuclease domain-containing protein [Gordonia sp. ABSL1-1]|uniref:ribonuclease domain-containing protein n=1 Tax=Gordonia sp. ABSL1-1 TaxID=3053923 RepID=UPI0025740E97|nr:ribonuclease domain-containing protein [Gordonia sp. ABSL1-1]MDL9937001.1 ribonuclease domain-containing protein [Gordonia sp. ABSL1-1]
MITAVVLVVVLAVLGVTWFLNNRTDDSSASRPAASTSTQQKSSAKASTTAKKTGATSTAAKPGSTKPKTPASSVPRPRATRTPAPGPSGDVPVHVQRTLTLIDSGDWPDAANAPGTRGGIVFRNSERRLPATDANGKRVAYQEWDVNPKQPGRGRDAERIVTGSDGSAWYTADHYRTFVQIRGPR